MRRAPAISPLGASLGDELSAADTDLDRLIANKGSQPIRHSALRVAGDRDHDGVQLEVLSTARHSTHATPRVRALPTGFAVTTKCSWPPKAVDEPSSTTCPPHRLRHFLFTWLKTQGIDDRRRPDPALLGPCLSHQPGDLLPHRPRRRSGELRQGHRPLPRLTGPSTLPHEVTLRERQSNRLTSNQRFQRRQPTIAGIDNHGPWPGIRSLRPSSPPIHGRTSIMIPLGS